MVKHRTWLFVTASLLVLGLVVPAASARTVGADKSSPDKSALVKYKLSHGYLVGDQARFNRLTTAAAARAARLHPGAPSPAAGPKAPVPGPSWEGLFQEDLSPPDPTDAIGPFSFIQAINLQLGIYDRNGVLITSAPFSVLTGSGDDFLSDPQILFDLHSNRFYYLILDVGDLINPKSTMRWGFSKTSNPTSIPGGFCNYETDFGWGGTIADYPKLGQTKDFLLVGVNVYLNLITFAGADVGWISKIQTPAPIGTCPSESSFLRGKQTQLKTSDGTTLTSTPVPGQQIDPRSDGWIVDVPDPTNSGATGTKLELYRVTRNPNGTANIPQNATSEVTVPFYSPPAPAPQMGGPHPLDTLDGRPTHAIAAVDPLRGSGNDIALWTGHTIFGGAGAEFRWYEIDVAHATLFQSGDVADPVLYAFNGAISPDRTITAFVPAVRLSYGANMVVGFTTSASSAFPAIQMVSKRFTNPQSAFVLVKQSPGPDEGFDCFELGRCRWGDYGGAFPDLRLPSQNAPTGKVWLSNMWATGESDPGKATWRTWNWGALP
ncbi:MAG TPA: hypothetical protein VGL18_03385 [Actinomycetota bacterium]|jgi:hypothetical protein